jgi:hypothetical protein
VANPKGDVPSIWGLKVKEDSKKVSFPQITAKWIVKDEGIPLGKACLRDKANETKMCIQWLVLQNINDYL